MPSLFILAGANGLGKTTFYFSAKENNFISSAIPFVNVDMIAKEELGGYSAQNLESANMIYRERVDGYIGNMQDFMIESNLAKQTDFDWLEKMKQKGYDIILFLLGTSNIEINIKRVERRVKEGGHHVPENIIRDRYDMANSIFGGSFNLNGFVTKYLPLIAKKLEENKNNLENNKQLLKANKLNELISILNDIQKEKKPEDIIAFFFAIENNKLIQSENIKLSFNQLLTNDYDFKIVFIVFYSAIIYHLANLMKAKRMEPPRHLTFSGTGSKIISIADESPELTSLQLLTRLLFEKIYAKPIEKIKLWQHSEPKEITCKGGLLNDKKIEIEHIKAVLLGDIANTLIPDTQMNYSQVNNDAILLSVVDEVERFIDLLFSLDKELNFADKFGVKSALITQYKSALKDDLITKLKSELTRKTKELEEGTEIKVEEPLFFYALPAALTNLSNEIVTQFKS